MVRKKIPNPIIPGIRSRLWRKNQNFMLVVVGPTGSSKSYSAIQTARHISPRFTCKNVVFTPEEFLSLLNSGKLKKGDTVIFDEAGCNLSSREWFSIQNRLLGYVMQVFRRENICLIMTLPSLDMLDSMPRKLFHGCIEMSGTIDRKNNRALCKFKLLKYNPLTGDFRTKFVRDNKGIPGKKIWIDKPPKGLIRAYEKKKKVFAQTLYRDSLEKIESMKSTSVTTKPNTKCQKCGHEWTYKGMRNRVTCPSCNSKVSSSTQRQPIYN